METVVEVSYIRIRDERKWEWWNQRWDLAGEITPELFEHSVLNATVDGVSMGPEWTNSALEKADSCGCNECAECLVAEQVDAMQRLAA